MRLAVLALLALNVIMLAAGLRGGVMPQAPGGQSAGLAGETESAGPPLRLLRESSPTPDFSPNTQAPRPPESAGATKPLPPADSAARPAPTPLPLPPVVSPTPELAAAPTTSPPADEAAAHTPSPPPMPATPAPAVPAEKRVAPSPPEPASRTPATASNPQALQCVMIGPAGTDDGRTVKSLDGLLSASGGQQITAVERRDGPLRHWVVLPGFASTGAALEVVDRLTAAGITDTAILPDGDASYLISAGVFAQQAGARRHADTLRGAGFQAVLRPRAAGAARQWVRAQVPAAAVDALRLPPGVRKAPCAPGSG